MESVSKLKISAVRGLSSTYQTIQQLVFGLRLHQRFPVRVSLKFLICKLLTDRNARDLEPRRPIELQELLAAEPILH